MNNTIKIDKERWKNEKRLWLIPQYRIVLWKRYCEIFKNVKFLYPFVWLIYRHICIKFCVDIPASVSIGPGFKIRHFGGIVINPNAVLGENIDILNGVLIGQEDRGKRKGCPKIGNNVFIGTNAVIIGSINIGDDVLIAPGTFVNFDVPSHSIVIGNPGKIISKMDATRGYLE